MRLLLVVVVAIAGGALFGGAVDAGAAASGGVMVAVGDTQALQEGEAQEGNGASDDAGDDGLSDVVAVQLLVAGAAIVLVVGVGLAGYWVRKRLDLIPPAPGTGDSGGH